MPDAIDKTAELFAKQAEQIRTRLITELAAVYKKGGDPAAFAEQMLSANFSEHIIRDMGFGADMDSLFAEYDKIAGSVAKTFGAVSQVAVEQLKSLDSLFFMEHVRDVGEALTRQMVYATYTGITEKALIENLLNATKKLSEAQIGSLTNTALRTFGRGTFAATAAEYAPADAKFVYVGPSIGARPICLEILAAGPMTRAEISAQFGDAFINGGGFNCRHSFALVTEGMGISKKAETDDKYAYKDSNITIENIETPKPREGFGHGFYDAKVNGGIYHNTTAEGLESLIENYDATLPVSFSTAASKKLIDKGYDGVSIRYNVKNRIGKYTAYDGDAGKYYGYDEFRTLLPNINNFELVVTDEMAEIIKIINAPGFNRAILNNIDYEYIGTIDFLSRYNIIPISRSGMSSTFFNITASSKTTDILNILKNPPKTKITKLGIGYLKNYDIEYIGGEFRIIDMSREVNGTIGNRVGLDWREISKRSGDIHETKYSYLTKSELDRYIEEAKKVLNP